MVEGNQTEPHVREFGQALAATALERDWTAVHSMLAPWLRDSHPVEDVRRFFGDDYAEIREENGIVEIHYPEIPYVSGNSSTLADLRAKEFPRPFAIPPEVTDSNYLSWVKIQIQCSEEQAGAFEFDCFTEVWLVFVDTDNLLRIGYWIHDPNA